MIKVVDPPETASLADYETYTHLVPAVEALREESAEHVARLRDRTVWMVNATAQGGGVAEMLPRLITLLCELGVDARWAVIEPEDERFFELTKRLHNLLHGTGDPDLSDEDRALYRRTSEALADAFAEHAGPEDLVVVHDPQPAGMGALLRERLGVRVVWRCHIGLDEENACTRAGWDFLRDHLLPYDRAVFTLEAYAPDYLRDCADVIHPAIDPLSPKNRPLRPHKLVGVLANAGLAHTEHPVLHPPFHEPVRRLQPDGALAPAALGEDVGLLFRPIVTQVSRWDRLKGWLPLLAAFADLKAHPQRYAEGHPERHRRRLDLTRLVLAGPEPEAVSDDPEGHEVFHELCARWCELPPETQRDVALLSLPMGSQEVNALVVNALQRCSTVVVQNSLREGFGLTATEAMWKETPVLGSRAAGLRAQIVDGETGCTVADPSDPEEVSATLNAMLAADEQREEWGRNARRRVHDRYLVFTQVDRWLEVLASERLAAGARPEAAAA